MLPCLSEDLWEDEQHIVKVGHVADLMEKIASSLDDPE